MCDYGVYVYIHLSILHNQNDILKYSTKEWDDTYKKMKWCFVSEKGLPHGLSCHHVQ